MECVTKGQIPLDQIRIGALRNKLAIMSVFDAPHSSRYETDFYEPLGIAIVFRTEMNVLLSGNIN